MKVTVIEKERKSINWRELPLGTVVEFVDGVQAVVVNDKDGKDGKGMLLLNYRDGSDFLDIAAGYKTEPVAKIVGKLTGVTVEEI
jgi:hypothetical protein